MEVTAAPAAKVKSALRKPDRKAAAKAALAKAAVAAVREVEAAQLVLPSRHKLRASQKNASRENHGSDLSREFPAVQRKAEPAEPGTKAVERAAAKVAVDAKPDPRRGRRGFRISELRTLKIHAPHP